MIRRALGVTLVAAALGWAWPAYREGPPPGHTGGFGEPLCSECHFGAPVNHDAGAVTLQAPERFRPGESYRLVVTLTHTDMAAAGFQAAVRFAQGTRAGRQAGALSPGDGRTAVTTDTVSGIAYGHQTLAGSTLTGTGRARWALDWAAPETAGDVVIHVAANAANDDASEFGDFVFATHQAVTPASASAPDSPSASASGSAPAPGPGSTAGRGP